MTVAADSAEGKALIARAHRLDAAADRAFARWFEGEVKSSSGAARLRSQADEAWSDVRFGIENGDAVEAREQGASA